MQKKLLSASALASVAAFLTSQRVAAMDVVSLPETVVTATRTETPINEIGSAISIITAKDIVAKNLTNVADALRSVPGLDVVRSGGAGQTTQVFIRGANANHTLVLIDGMEANDPADANAAFDFAYLQTDNIERIEILRGAASSVYGSDAIGGVINVITKKGQGKPSFTLSAEGGRYGTWKSSGAIAGSMEQFNYSLNAARLETAGFPAADKNLGNTSADAYRNTTVSGRSGLNISESLDVGATFRYNAGKTFFDNCGGPGLDCNNPFSWNTFNEVFTRGFAHLELYDRKWEQTLGVGYGRTQREYTSQLNPANDPSWQNPYASVYLGEKLKLDYQSVVHIHETNTVTFGAEEETDSLRTASTFFSAGFPPSTLSIPHKTMSTNSYYLQDQLKFFKRAFTTLGIRYDNNNRFGGHTTWRVNQLYDLKETGTRFKGSYGTGFKAPTLFQLYDTLFNTGNPALKPETSLNWDAGLEQDLWRDNVTAGVSYFNNTLSNLIQYVPTGIFTGKNQNVASASAKGLETFLEVKPSRDLSIRGSYTYQQTWNTKTASQLKHRPDHKAGFDVDYRFLEKAQLHLNLLVVGAKADYDQNAHDAMVAAYTVVNISGTYDINSCLQLYGRVDNLLDKQYQEVWGYGTSGLAGYGGIKASF